MPRDVSVSDTLKTPGGCSVSSQGPMFENENKILHTVYLVRFCILTIKYKTEKESLLSRLKVFLRPEVFCFIIPIELRFASEFLLNQSLMLENIVPCKSYSI